MERRAYKPAGRFLVGGPNGMGPHLQADAV
jgi:hypothetical protein